MRLQLALNVRDLDAAIDFYTRMFATEPAKVRPGYANFAVEDPPLKLVLFEDRDADASAFHHLNHLGVETTTSAEVTTAEERLTSRGVETTGVDDTVCCFARKTETWVESPDGAAWEWYVKTGDAEADEPGAVPATASGPPDLLLTAPAPAPGPTRGGPGREEVCGLRSGLAR
ncbi:ArsI/CadI family heavy metal resistance metalloenzyme [Ilumatobacter sp.]|uniref:ArsI/CadI family heavy metal resistance metalloenzyme n=1 Tax=Ilumatobacter sp. TaxID=1967498 RepID=UPI003B51A0C4